MFSAIEYRDFAPNMRYFQKDKFLKKLYNVAHKRDPVENLALYDANIRYVDDNIKRLFSNLEELDIKDQTTVAITSDHGEAFGENGFWDHHTCYRNISQLPLILLGPTIQDKNIASYTQNVDIMPTLLELGGLEVPAKLCGRTMVPLFKEGRNDLRTEVVVNSDAAVIQRMYVKDNYALVHSLARPVWDHIEEYELFNLSKDPDQLKDISSEERNRTSQMRLALDDWLAQELKGTPDPLQLSVFRGGWAWNILSRRMGQLDLAEITGEYPEIKRALCRKSILDLL